MESQELTDTTTEDGVDRDSTKVTEPPATAEFTESASPLHREIPPGSQENSVPGFLGLKKTYRDGFVQGRDSDQKVFESFYADLPDVKEEIHSKVSSSIALVRGYMAWKDVWNDIAFWVLIVWFVIGLLIAILLFGQLSRSFSVMVCSVPAEKNSPDGVLKVLLEWVAVIGVAIMVLKAILMLPGDIKSILGFGALVGLFAALAEKISPDGLRKVLLEVVAVMLVIAVLGVLILILRKASLRFRQKDNRSGLLLLLLLCLFFVLLLAAALLWMKLDLFRTLGIRAAVDADADAILMLIFYAGAIVLSLYFGLVRDWLDRVLLISFTLLVTVAAYGLFVSTSTTAQALVALMVAFVICVLCSILDLDLSDPFILFLGVVTVILAGVLLYAWPPSDLMQLSTSSDVLAGMVAGLMVSIGWTIVMFILLFVSNLPYKFKERTAIRSHPKEVIIQSLCHAIVFLSEHRADWNSSEIKNDLIDQLEWISQRVERELFAGTPGNDYSTVTWLSRRTTGIAEGIRKKKQSILLPNDGSYKDLVKSLSEFLVFAAEDRWVDFPYENVPDAISRPARAWSKVRTTLPVVIPVLLTLLVWFNPMDKIPMDFRDTLILFLFPWAFAQLIYLVDPKFGDTTNAQTAAKAFVPKQFKP